MFDMSYLKRVLFNLIKNFHLMGKYNIQDDYLNKLNEIDRLRGFIVSLCLKNMPELAQQYSDELDFLDKKNIHDMFPYDQVKTLESDEILVGVDKRYKLPYVLHNGKKLFFPACWNPKEVSEKYKYYIERENLLGGGFTSKAPHQYQSEQFKIESGDILLDIGCAEGLIALDSIDNLKKLYLYEADPIWQRPLHATFAPYKDKVVIINKWVSDKDDSTSVTLNSSVKEDPMEHFFVKMDIEGAEEMVVKGNSDFFLNRKINVACCTYHKYNHYSTLKDVFEKWGYSVSSSDGYMLCFMDNVFQPPYFRKGVIRASNLIKPA